MRKEGLYKVIFCLLVFFINEAGFAQTDTPVVDTIISQVSTTADTLSEFSKVNNASAVQARPIADSIIQKLKSDDDYWYVNTVPPRQKKVEEKSSGGESIFEKAWFSNLVWFLIVGSFVAILIWFLASSNIKLFRKRDVAIVDEDLEITEENIFSLDYEKEIHKAISDQNYRLAIRLWYLNILKEMADKNIIQYQHEKTNRDYLDQLDHTHYYDGFFRLTRNFEYSWYGQFPLQADGFQLLQKDFQTFKQQLQ
ncbi:MAG: hypothetical protein ACTHOF_01160 [Flavisolibacter sp.]|jgi:hypothetical protein